MSSRPSSALRALGSRLLQLTPRQVLWRAWGMLILASLLQLLPGASAIALAIVLLAFAGYSYVMALVLPEHPRDATVRAIVVVMFRLWLVVLSLVAVSPLLPEVLRQFESPSDNYERALQLSFGVLLNFLLWTPCLFATHLLDEARRRNGDYKPLDSVPTALGFMLGIFGGVIYVHRLCREVGLGPAVGKGCLTPADNLIDGSGRCQ